MNCEVFGRKQPCPIPAAIPEFSLEEIVRNLTHDSRRHVRKSKSAPPEYESNETDHHAIHLCHTLSKVYVIYTTFQGQSPILSSDEWLLLYTFSTRFTF
jgi:hypothetical protein